MFEPGGKFFHEIHLKSLQSTFQISCVKVLKAVLLIYSYTNPETLFIHTHFTLFFISNANSYGLSMFESILKEMYA